MPDEVLTVSRLITTVGPTVCQSPTTADKLLERVISTAVVFDPLDDLPDLPGGVLFLVGVASDNENMPQIVAEVVERGYSAVAIKLHGRSAASLGSLPSTIAVIVVNDDIPWRHLDEMLSAVTSGQRTDDGINETGLFELANAVAMAAGGSVAIEDLERNVLAYSTVDGQVVDSVRQNGILRVRSRTCRRTTTNTEKSCRPPAWSIFPMIQQMENWLAAPLPFVLDVWLWGRSGSSRRTYPSARTQRQRLSRLADWPLFRS